MNKKASIQLSVNFLVVMIICIVLLGIGIKLIHDLGEQANEIKENVDKYHQQQLRKELTRGSLVASYPTEIPVKRGKHADFSIGIRNQLDTEKNFSIFVEEDSYNTPIPAEFKFLYIPGPYIIKNNAQKFISVRIIVPKEASRGSYIFNVFACKVEDCEFRTEEESYGSMQKMQINVE